VHRPRRLVRAVVRQRLTNTSATADDPPTSGISSLGKGPRIAGAVQRSWCVAADHGRSRQHARAAAGEQQRPRLGVRLNSHRTPAASSGRGFKRIGRGSPACRRRAGGAAWRSSGDLPGLQTGDRARVSTDMADAIGCVVGLVVRDSAGVARWRASPRARRQARACARRPVFQAIGVVGQMILGSCGRFDVHARPRGSRLPTASRGGSMPASG